MSSTWRQADHVFDTRPREAVIKGKKVRNRRPILLAPLFEPVEGEEAAVSLVANKVGFVAGYADGDVLFAYSRNPNAAPADLETLRRTGVQQVVRIKWSTFETQFDIAS
jgi:hypothetical protein